MVVAVPPSWLAGFQNRGLATMDTQTLLNTCRGIVKELTGALPAIQFVSTLPARPVPDGSLAFLSEVFSARLRTGTVTVDENGWLVVRLPRAPQIATHIADLYAAYNATILFHFLLSLLFPDIQFTDKVEEI